MKQKYLTRPVKCIDTGEVFQSIKEASEKYNISRTSITACCKGEYLRAGGKMWEYLGEMKVKKDFSACANAAREKLSKKVQCIETGKIYNSAKEAGLAVGLYNGSLITACCRGRKNTAKNFHWKYID